MDFLMRYMKYTFYNYFCDSLFMMTEYNKEKECGTKKKRVKKIEEKRQTTRTDADVDGMEWDGMVVYYNTLVSTTSMKSVTNRFFGT